MRTPGLLWERGSGSRRVQDAEEGRDGCRSGLPGATAFQRHVLPAEAIQQVRGHESSSFLGTGGVVGSAYRGAGILRSTQGFSPSAETDLDFIFFNNIAVNIPWLMVPRRAQDS